MANAVTIEAVADLHGNLPGISPCDLLLIAGDICPDTAPNSRQAQWLDSEFRSWLEWVPARHVVGVAGNHDFAFERVDLLRRVAPDLPWHYLQDSGIHLAGLNIWGTPWSMEFGGGAFEVTDFPGGEIAYSATPENTDIMLCHQPPRGHGDLTGEFDHRRGLLRGGSSSLARTLRRVQPQLLVCGHIHTGHGISQEGETVVANVAVLDDAGCLARPATALTAHPTGVGPSMAFPAPDSQDPGEREG